MDSVLLSLRNHIISFFTKSNVSILINKTSNTCSADPARNVAEDNTFCNKRCYTHISPNKEVIELFEVDVVIEGIEEIRVCRDCHHDFPEENVIDEHEICKCCYESLGGDKQCSMCKHMIDIKKFEMPHLTRCWRCAIKLDPKVVTTARTKKQCI
jgi:hypothetical protein